MADQHGKVIPDKIHVPLIKVINFSIQANQDYLDNPVPRAGMTLKIGKEVAYSIKNKAARFRLYFECQAIDSEEQDLELTADIGIEFHFIIDNFSSFVDQDEAIEDKIAATLMGIAYSTARGIVLEKTQNTHFEAIILPVIDPYNLLLEDEQVRPND